MTVKLPQEQVKFIENWADIMRIPNLTPKGIETETWYFMPFYLKKDGEGMFEIVSFEKLPQHVTDFIRRFPERFKEDFAHIPFQVSETPIADGVKIWQTTPRLRWLRAPIEFDPINSKFNLQQLFVDTQGNEEWRNVEVAQSQSDTVKSE